MANYSMIQRSDLGLELSTDARGRWFQVYLGDHPLTPRYGPYLWPDDFELAQNMVVSAVLATLDLISRHREQYIYTVSPSRRSLSVAR